MEQTARYEVLILTVPEITQDEGKDLETRFDKTIRAHQGNILSFERWGKYKLAYPVNKNEYGVYFLSRFEVPKSGQTMEDIKDLFAIKLENIVMRTVVSSLDQEGSLEYQRPRSLEEAPAREEGYTRSDRRSERYSAPSNEEPMIQAVDEAELVDESSE